MRPAEFPLAAAAWVDDPGFCAKDHIELHYLDGPDCRDGAADLAAELMIRPMQRNRPLWEFRVGGHWRWPGSISTRCAESERTTAAR
jgi:hypothetical protein